MPEEWTELQAAHDKALTELAQSKAHEIEVITYWESLQARVRELEGVAQLLLLFYTVDWTPEKKAEWDELTGGKEATTRVLADFARAVLREKP